MILIVYYICIFHSWFHFRASTNLCMDTSTPWSHRAQRRFQRSLWGIPRRLYNYSGDPSCKNIGCRNVQSGSRKPKWQGKSRLRSYCPRRPARSWMWLVSESGPTVHMHSFLYWVSEWWKKKCSFSKKKRFYFMLFFWFARFIVLDIYRSLDKVWYGYCSDSIIHLK